MLKEIALCIAAFVILVLPMASTNQLVLPCPLDCPRGGAAKKVALSVADCHQCGARAPWE